MNETILGIQVNSEKTDNLLTPEALNFFANIHREFGNAREQCLKNRNERTVRIQNGQDKPGFLKETEALRALNWQVAPAPKDLTDRRVEITGPTDAKMLINALNSGANVFMADLEDATSPTWFNIIDGLLNLKAAVRHTLDFKSPEGKEYKLNAKTATLMVRPRGWHLEEKNVLVDGKPASASIFDFCMYFFHNTTENLRRGSGSYFYLPKLESHLEARLWNDIFNMAQDQLNIPRGTIRATVLIETILAAFEMEEILYELKDHMAGLNAGRWDYIFSAIKKFRHDKNFCTPDRAQITMTVPYMRAYTELLVRTCHKRGAHAIGGMAAFIPSRKDAQINKIAMLKVREDKEREAADGFDGTWVAHPDLVAVAKEVFDRVMTTEKPNQKHRLREEVDAKRSLYETQLVAFNIPGGKITENGVRLNINIALQYLERWLAGVGATAIHNLMEDAATAEISRAQLWQWVHHKVKLDDGRVVDTQLYRLLCSEELAKLTASVPTEALRFEPAHKLLNELVEQEWKWDFLTLPAYKLI